MGIFSFLKTTPAEFFSEEEKSIIHAAVQEAERQTSGEIRVFVESKCEYVNALDRAKELFFKLQMEKTAQRNGVLVYIAMKDHQLAIYGDEGIYQKTGQTFWDAEVSKMIAEFNASHFAGGIAEIVSDIGEALRTHFPFDGKTDKNELPDEMVFGR